MSSGLAESERRIEMLVPYLSISTTVVGISPRDIEGIWARYDFEEESKPELSHILISFPKVVKTELPLRHEGGSSLSTASLRDEDEAIWFQMEAFSGEKRRYAVTMLVEDLEFLKPEGNDVKSRRYILFPEEGKPLEYVSSRTDGALLPNFDFVLPLLPHASNASDPDFPLFCDGTYLGYPIKRVEKGNNAKLLPVDKAHKLVLETDILVGTGRNFKDAEGRRLYLPGQYSYPSGPNYTYTPFTVDDYREMIDEVGMNLFVISPEQLSSVIDRPVFFVLGEGFEKLPDLLYRSNFWGSVQFMDEPAWLAIAHNEVVDSHTPQEAALKFLQIVRDRREADGSYGMHNLTNRLKNAGYDFGGLEILQPDYPVWETVTSAAWYEFEAGMPGYVFEGRYRPGQFAELVKEKLDVDFPDDIESCLNFHYAFYRGAARCFKGKWGVAIYGQMASEVIPKAFPIAYEQGAVYFWFWTSDHAHHVPFVEQKEITKKFREYVRLHPRSVPSEELIHRAEVAIVLPWGYLLDDVAIRSEKLWGSSHMTLEAQNGCGVTYRDVFQSAMKEAAELLKSEILFDFIFLKEGEKAEEYQEVIRVLENGKVSRLENE